MKKLKKLSEQADLITDNSNGAQAEQVHKLKQMVKKVDMSKKKKETTYVKAKRGKIHQRLCARLNRSSCLFLSRTL